LVSTKATSAKHHGTGKKSMGKLMMRILRVDSELNICTPNWWMIWVSILICMNLIGGTTFVLECPEQ